MNSTLEYKTTRLSSYRKQTPMLLNSALKLHQTTFIGNFFPITAYSEVFYSSKGMHVKFNKT